MTTRTVNVDLGDRSYSIHIAPGLLDSCGPLVHHHLSTKRALIIADEQVAKLHASRLTNSLNNAGIQTEITTFPAGEPSKSLATADRLWQECARIKLDRSCAIIALGGGVSGDLAGFVAACWMRGVTFIQIPTTLLAMVDSSVGGKTGVNSPAGKNLVGAFKQPACVIIDPSVVETMELREYRSGLAEVLKYGVIKDPDFFAWQEANAAALTNRNPNTITHAVAESCRLKAWYVSEDELELGVRAHLNYGHTFGHALERDTSYKTFLHGEAIGIGMRMACALAQSLGLLTDASLAQRQDHLLNQFSLPLHHRCTDIEGTAARLTDHCLLDKKVAGGRARFVLPSRLGEVATHTVEQLDLVRDAFRIALSQD